MPSENKNAPMKPLPASRQPPSPTMSAPGEVRIGPVMAIPAVLSDLGASPQRAFARAGVDLRLFDDPDRRIRVDDLGSLFETCVALTGCDHFGLLVGQRFGLNDLGPLGCLMRNSGTVGEAVRSLLRHLHLHDRGAAPVLLAPDRSCVMLGYSVYCHGTSALAQIQDAAVAIGYTILAELCGPAWKALRVQFSHGPPESSAAYQQVFRANVSFDAEVSGLVFASSWLERAVDDADETLHGIVAEAIREAEANAPTGFAEQVERVLPQMVLTGMTSSEAVARLFAVHERTLRRRLDADGQNLRRLVSQARFELAKQLLDNTRLGVSAIAAALKYDDPNAFSRAFRNWAKVSPTEWRAWQLAAGRRFDPGNTAGRAPE